jgi:hypothetical protein
MVSEKNLIKKSSKNPLCSKNGKNLCSKLDCEICHQRRFINSSKFILWNTTYHGQCNRNLLKSNKNIYTFTCNICNHDFENTIANIEIASVPCPFCSPKKSILCQDLNCNICLSKSLLGHIECMRLWHPTLNTLDPRQIRQTSAKDKIWLICDDCDHDYEKSANDFCILNKRCPYCVIGGDVVCGNINCTTCHTFVEHPMAQYWHPTLNGSKLPHHFKYGSKKKCYITCPNMVKIKELDDLEVICSHAYEVSIGHITSKKSCRCPYCFGVGKNAKLCDFETEDDCIICYHKSLASHPLIDEYCLYENENDENKLRPQQIFKHASLDNSFWFKCSTCQHKKQNCARNIHQCGYCRGELFCNNDNCNFCYDKSFQSNPMSQYWHPTKNLNADGTILTPRFICKNSTIHCWFTCPECNFDFESNLNHVNYGQFCPHCVNPSELKLQRWLRARFDNVQTQHTIEECKNSETQQYFPFDFLITINGINIIIELDGKQHFVDVPFFNSTAEGSHRRDKFKMENVFNNNYKMIRIFQEYVWFNKGNWKTKLTEAINHLTNSNDIVQFIDFDLNYYDRLRHEMFGQEIVSPDQFFNL